MVERKLQVADLLSKKWTACFLLFARLRTLHIADVERRHRRNRAMTLSNKSWAHFVASYINGEAKSLFQTWCQERSLLRAACGSNAPQALAVSKKRRLDARPLPAAERVVTRQRKPLEFFRLDVIARERLLQRKFNPASKEFWELVRAEFGRLSPEQQQHYEDRSAASGVDGRAERRRRKASAGQAHAPIISLADAPCIRHNVAEVAEVQRASTQGHIPQPAWAGQQLHDLQSFGAGASDG